MQRTPGFGLGFFVFYLLGISHALRIRSFTTSVAPASSISAISGCSATSRRNDA